MMRRVRSNGAHSPKGRYTGRCLERGAVVLLLLLAWSWVFVLFGMVFYHGYYIRGSSSQVAASEASPKTFKKRFHSVQQVIRNELDNLHAIENEIKQVGEKIAKEKYTILNRGDNRKARFVGSTHQLHPHESPLLIFTCNRDEYLRQTMTDVLKYIPTDCSMGCPIIISQDGTNPEVAAAVQEFQQQQQKSGGVAILHIQHKRGLRGAAAAQAGASAYQALAEHYGWALKQVFDNKINDINGNVNSSPSPQRVLILEEDIHVAADFFDYFRAMAPVLDLDRSLLAVSAFNDNGYENKVKDATRVLRSDFFPGLGWMMNRRLWDMELSAKWPTGYWDDWLREPAQRKDRHVLRPEISRTFHFGTKGGASGNQFGDRLGKVWLNPTPIDWSVHAEDLLQQLEVDAFNAEYWKLIQSAQPANSLSNALEACKQGNVRLEYQSWSEFQSLARQLELMDDEKAGIPRTGYKGVVETRPHGDFLLFLIPPLNAVQQALQVTTAATSR